MLCGKLLSCSVVTELLRGLFRSVVHSRSGGMASKSIVEMLASFKLWSFGSLWTSGPIIVN